MFPNKEKTKRKKKKRYAAALKRHCKYSSMHNVREYESTTV